MLVRFRPQMGFGFSITPDWGAVGVSSPVQDTGASFVETPTQPVGVQDTGTTFTTAPRPSGPLAISSLGQRATASVARAAESIMAQPEAVVQSQAAPVYTAPPASSASSAGWGGGTSGVAYGAGSATEQPVGIGWGTAAVLEDARRQAEQRRITLDMGGGGGGGGGLPFGLTQKQLLIGGAAVLAFMYFTSGGAR